MKIHLYILMALCLSAASTCLSGTKAHAQSTSLGASGNPLPRYVSIKAKRVNMRVGPGKKYAVSWLYKKSGTPMEIIQEYDHWRKVRDSDGTEGWMHKSLLSSERYAITAPWMRSSAQQKYINLYSENSITSKISARVEPGKTAQITQCDGQWCRLNFKDHNIKGWIDQTQLWGAYPNEAFK